jgi:DNA-binding NarL/FixJ family response regulator
MDIKVSIIDQNEIFRESLKMLLAQIPGFDVAILPDANNYTKSLVEESHEVLLLDDSMGQDRCRAIISELHSQNKSLKIIILTLDHQSPEPDYGETVIMLKYSGKKVFEHMIKSLFTPAIS